MTMPQVYIFNKNLHLVNHEYSMYDVARTTYQEALDASRKNLNLTSHASHDVYEVIFIDKKHSTDFNCDVDEEFSS